LLDSLNQKNNCKFESGFGSINGHIKPDEVKCILFPNPKFKILNDSLLIIALNYRKFEKKKETVFLRLKSLG
jgi:hypothetical protein